jgi:hypothetical protein
VSKSKLWKCYSCTNPDGTQGKPFEAVDPVCPDCKTDKRAGVRERELIVERVTIHYQPPEGFGERKLEGFVPIPRHKAGIACAAGKPIIPGTRFSGVVEAVNCPGCLAVVKSAAEAEVVPDEPEVVESIPMPNSAEQHLPKIAA